MSAVYGKSKVAMWLAMILGMMVIPWVTMAEDAAVDELVVDELMMDGLMEDEVVDVTHEVKNDAFPEEVQFFNVNLHLNGMGERHMFQLKMYELGLYTTRPESNANLVVTANEPMGLRMHVYSEYVTIEKIKEAFVGWLLDNYADDFANLYAHVDVLMQNFGGKVYVGDVYDLFYDPQKGVVLFKDGVSLGSSGNLQLKQALFSLWLSDDSKDLMLRQALLGDSESAL